MAAIDSGGGESGKKAVNQEIPLIPFIDLLLCCVMFLLATAVWNLEQWERAEKAARRALELDPSLEKTKLLLADVLEKQDRADEAEALLAEIATGDPALRAERAFNRGAELYNQGDVAEAIAAFEEALEADPQLAEAYYAEIAPHLYCGPIEAAANIQLDTCSPNFLIQESIETWGGFHAEILKKPIEWEDGYIIPPTAPGLGVELDEEVAARHPYTGDRLHLEMVDHPVY